MSQSILEGVTHPFASGMISLLAGLATPSAVLQIDFPSLTDINSIAAAHEAAGPAQDPRLEDSNDNSGSAGDALSLPGDFDADYEKNPVGFAFSSFDMGSISDIDRGIGGPSFEDRHPGLVEAGPFSDQGDIAVAPLPQAVVGALGMLVALAGCRHARRKAMETATGGPRTY